MKEEKSKGTVDLEKAKKEMVWHCDIYCRKVRHVTCEGREQVDEKSKNRCPYLEEMLY